VTLRGETGASLRIVFTGTIWHPRPVWHRYGAWGKVVEDGVHLSTSRTACGKLLHLVEWREVPGATSDVLREEDARVVWMRLDHLRLFGRPCQRCERAAR
jgi:hypothetical protein